MVVTTIIWLLTLWLILTVVLVSRINDCKFLLSWVIWSFVFFPTAIAGGVLVAVLLPTNWDGKSLFCGNALYPRGIGNGHMPSNPTLWQQYEFLVFRNPVSNFGKFVLSVRGDRSWAWLEEKPLFGDWWLKYGWKPVDFRTGGYRTFICRPWKKE